MKKIDGFITSPKGFIAAGVRAGIKKSKKEDVAVIYSTALAAQAAVFTQNMMASPAVVVSRKIAKEDFARAIVINSGCANACTGEQGLLDAKKMLEITARCLKIQPQEVFVCSTGVIGHFLPMDKIESGIKDACSQLATTGGESATLAIQTTDTFVKKSAYEIELSGQKVTIAGIAKGAGMIHPNMATMLAFITTDAAVCPKLLKSTVKHIADRSFNMVVVDGDTSTNDSMIVLANGEAKNNLIDSQTHPDFQLFYDALMQVSKDLAMLIARDGEGATKFLQVHITGAKSFEDAKLVAMAIAKSPLVKTAFFGQDPNWGRIVCAAGYCGVQFEPENVSVSLNGLEIFANGMNAKADEEKLASVMKEKDILIDVALGAGEQEASVWTCDFSYDYVKINAEYHT